jgi:hypothetical protein
MTLGMGDHLRRFLKRSFVSATSYLNLVIAIQLNHDESNFVSATSYLNSGSIYN